MHSIILAGVGEAQQERQLTATLQLHWQSLVPFSLNWEEEHSEEI